MRPVDLLRQVCQAMLFPQTCVLCGTCVLNPDFSPLCTPCLESLEGFGSHLCALCGVPLPGSVLDSFAVCSVCRTQGRLYDFARSMGAYQGRLREVIHQYKFGGHRRLAFPLACRLAATFRASRLPFVPDWIAPVPLHPRRVAERGFHPTLALARVLAAELRIPVFRGLKRVRHTPPQFGLGCEDRSRNVAGAFILENVEDLAERHLLLVDDVLTTGSTVNEVCRLLRRKSEVGQIMVLTVARAPLVDQL